MGEPERYLVNGEHVLPTCNRCRWWYVEHRECRRRSPITRGVPADYGAEGSPIWPHTQAIDFCGEFQIATGPES